MNIYWLKKFRRMRLLRYQNQYALMTEKDLADVLKKGSLAFMDIEGKWIGSLLARECALRLSDYSFHLRRARQNSFALGMSAAFFLVGLVFWLASIVRGEM